MESQTNITRKTHVQPEKSRSHTNAETRDTGMWLLGKQRKVGVNQKKKMKEFIFPLLYGNVLFFYWSRVD